MTDLPNEKPEGKISKDSTPVSDTNEQIQAINQQLTNTLVTGILKKHGVDRSKLKPLSEERKQELRDLVNDLKSKLEALSSNTVKETAPTKKRRIKRKNLMD
ncbi:hypothetical protein GMB86_14190 [Terrilactibacillus sp. BCM23-1]|uniref:Spore coat protein n=1 Tax=Terrilactibacillus tamarindi TaxID=2599694 RepID=A0A6N8CTQ9_9BACI|nr:hypothetical protein [Terrilactibacillus tamarindi]MTT33150.1 hypothetical protein [Terrilactibacillus tamarindi]